LAKAEKGRRRRLWNNFDAVERGFGRREDVKLSRKNASVDDVDLTPHSWAV
jgi:hypothetical protein